jgi:alanyl-tRNA synthetase
LNPTTSPSLPRSAKEIRERFLKYFQSQDHALVASSSLVPGDDPTLLFTNAGMVQFKDYFAGVRKAPYLRAVSSQRCLRAGGKHNDLENVGFTPRHHTFFEMLGNFSFGDYFKRDAIRFAWDFLTQELRLEKDRLWVTIFAGEDGIPADEEAFSIWHREMGVPSERIQRLGSKDNFWSMGETGPCGPCSEIHFDRGEAFDPPGIQSTPADDTGRYMEIWNLVFMQFNRLDDGTLKPLPKPAIDTGMGLERITSVLQGLSNNYDTDVFLPIIEKIAQGVEKKYHAKDADDTSMRVVADHARSTAFLIADGVLPSNEGRGYVLRRIMRRAIRHGARLGYQEPFFHTICEEVVHQMGDIYPELLAQQKSIREAVHEEEIRFRRTLARGLKLLEEEMEALRKDGKTELSGDTAFKLYDTYGFPLDLTRVICTEAQIAVDEAGFEAAMQEQQESGRASWKGQDNAAMELYQTILSEDGTTRFLGYECEEAEGKVCAILSGGRQVEKAEKGEQVEIFLDVTPFYGESGGQVGDEGEILSKDGLLVAIRDTQKPLPDLIVHRGEILQGAIAVGETVTARVNTERRSAIRRNHSATHLLHWALRQRLGDHIRQAGSLVAPDRLRFDYAHYNAPSEEDLASIEAAINAEIRANDPNETVVVDFEEARKAGAMALFGEKYGDRVRMVRMGKTLELCGGTHVRRSGDIGQLRIVSEQGIQAGVRRIEAVTGEVADQLGRRWYQELVELSGMLRCRIDEIPERVEKMRQQIKALQKDLEQSKRKAAQATEEAGDPLSQIQEIAGIRVLALRSQIGEPKALREMAEQYRDRLKSGVVILGGAHEEKASLCVMVSPDLKDRVHAGKLIGKLAEKLGGKGGGRPDMAQGGGSDLHALDATLKGASQILQQLLHP